MCVSITAYVEGEFVDSFNRALFDIYSRVYILSNIHIYKIRKEGNMCMCVCIYIYK